MITNSRKFSSVLFIVICSLFLPALNYSQETITIGAVNWAPFTGEQLQDFGFVSEITRLAMSHSDYNIQIDFIPWARALYKIKTGEIDGILGVYHTGERTEWMAYTEPVGDTDLIFLQMKNANAPTDYNSLQDLKNMTIGTPRGFAVTPEFDKAEYLKKEEVLDTYHSLKMLLKGRVDIIVDSREVLNYLIENEFPEYSDSTVELYPSLDNKIIYNAFSKSNPDYSKLVALFNNGLRKLKDNGTYELVKQKHGIQ